VKEIIISPVTRISGLLSVDLSYDVSGTSITEANCNGEQFRGFELMMRERKATDTVYFTQRICGICSMAHGFTAARLVEKIYGITPTPEMIILQQAMLGAEFLQNHIRHFYLLALPDYLNSDFLPYFPVSASSTRCDSRLSEAQQRLLIEHYFAAMEYSRKCHNMLSVFGGKIPHQHGLTAAGVTVAPTADRRLQFLSMLEEVRVFLNSIMLTDVYLLADAYADYFNIGNRPARLISFGLFDPRFGGYFPAGVFDEGDLMPVQPEDIRESVTFSWYAEDGTETKPQPDKPGAYTWVKAPRYHGLSCEGGPLARKIIKYGNPVVASPGVMIRLLARAEEALLISQWMADWINDLPDIGQYIIPTEKAILPEAIQLNDAPRGPLLHAMAVSGETVTHYNVITPSTWNFSPKDATGQRGPCEEALVGTVITDPTNPVEPGRIIRSFDPCLNCGTH
jgi:hydrogenase large subunit